MVITKHKTSAPTREDGRETRAAIIEWAGTLFAKKGYANTTSKEICQAAGVNLAAVNYHFGSRDGLYIAVLEEVHDYLLNIDILTELSSRPWPPDKKLKVFLDFYIEAAFEKNDWHVRVWIRELLNPSPFIGDILSRKGLPKFFIIQDLFREALGFDGADIRSYSAFLSLTAPFILTFIAQDSPVLSCLPVRYPREQFISALKDNFLRTVEALNQNHQ